MWRARRCRLEFCPSTAVFSGCGQDVSFRVSVLSLPCAGFRRHGHWYSLRGADSGVPRLSRIGGRVYVCAATSGSAGEKVSRLFPAGDSSGDIAGWNQQATVGLAEVSAGLPFGIEAYCGMLERSGSLPAMWQFHGEKRASNPNLGLIREIFRIKRFGGLQILRFNTIYSAGIWNMGNFFNELF